MADCGWLSLRCGSSIQRDMDSCPSVFSGATRNHPTVWQTGNGPRASSCLSSTMVEHNDPDDSGSSQARTPVDSKQSVIRDRSIPYHELELSISSLNDAQRGAPPLRLRSVKDEFDPISPSSLREDTVGGSSAGVVEEEPSLLGPPRKRARMGPLGLRLEDSHSPGLVRDQSQVLQRHPSLSVSLSATGEVTGLPNLTPSRSLPSFRSGESDPSASSSRAIAGPGPGGGQSISWWLGQGSRPPTSAMFHSEGPGHHYQPVQETARANFAIDGRGLIPGTTLQERELGTSSTTKQPSFFPNMLSSMETSEHASRSEELAAGVVGAKTTVSQEHGRPQIFLDRPHEHSFLHQKDTATTTTTSRASNMSTMSEETVPRSGYPIFGKSREAAASRESLQDHAAAAVYGQQHQQRPSDPVPRRQASGPESQQGVLEREPPAQQYSLSRQQVVDQQVVDQQRTMFGPSGGNANTTFYAKILDAAQQPAASSGPTSQAGLASAFNVNKSGGLSFNLAAQSITRAPSQAVHGHIQFGGEGATSNVAQQQSNNEVLRGLVAANPNIGPISPFISQVHNPDPGRLSFPNRTSLDFLQSLQRQSFPSQEGPDRYRPTPQQEFPYLSSTAQHPAGAHHQSLSTELNPLPPRPRNLQQTSSGLRDFLSPPRAPKATPFGGGVGRSSSVGGGSASLEIPTHLSLQAASSPSLTVSMEGRSIVRRIGLQDYDGYDSFAKALRSMFNSQVSTQESRAFGETCTLANAISGYVIAYEDEEGDILLAGDLPWRDFVRAAKQIKIVSSSKISFQPPAGREDFEAEARGLKTEEFLSWPLFADGLN